MSSVLAHPVMQAYVASTVVLGFNLIALASFTAITRTGASEVVNPEDKKLNATADVVFDAGNDRTARFKRAHRNALENLPLFMVSGFLLTLTPISTTFAAALFGVFVVMRVLHSICYVGSVQPWRTVSFGISTVAQVVILGYLGYALTLA